MPNAADTQPDKWWLDWNRLGYANPDIFGPIVGGHTIQEAIYSTLHTWLPAYIAEFNRVLGGQILTVPTEYRIKPDHRNLTPKVEASVFVSCPGTSKQPQRHGHQTRAVWNPQVSLCVNGTMDWQETQAITFAYGAAARTAIAQHESLGGIAESTMWMGEVYKEKEHLSNRTIGLILIDFEVTTATTLDIHAGPPSPQYTALGSISDPSTLPYPNAPSVTGANVTVVKTTPPLTT